MNDVPVAACVHWWLVAPPGGPTSRETYRLCGASRKCSNVEADWTNDQGKFPPKAE